MSRDFPSGLLEENRSAFGMVFVERQLLHVFSPTTSWTRARVFDENSLRETIFVTPSFCARFQPSTSSRLANERIGMALERSPRFRASIALKTSSASSLMLRRIAAGLSVWAF